MRKLPIVGKLIIVFVIFIFLFNSRYDLSGIASDFTSTNFILRDPVLSVGGGYGSSSSFQYITSLGQTVIGESTSASFIDKAGFLYYSKVTNPVLSGTGGNTSASLTWTAATGALGVNVSAYEVGVATTSGGPYSYTNVGNVLSSNRTGLTNNTTYYFVIRALDSLGDPVAVSNQVSVVPAGAVSGGGGGGGGGGGSGTITTGIILSGYAYPLSHVTILKDGVIVAQTIAGPDAKFSVTLGGISAGSYNFAVYSEDKDGIRSDTFSFPALLTTGATITISGIFITPTIDVDKSQVKKGDDLVIFGQTAPTSTVTIQVNSEVELFKQTTSNGSGIYLYNLDTSPLEIGPHNTKSKSLLSSGISSGYGRQVAFAVGTENIPKTKNDNTCHGDLNSDSRVNLVDFSIAAFWVNKKLDASMLEKEKTCLNHDGLINLVDFSIMAFYWTG